jgi:hypothetical protein
MCPLVLIPSKIDAAHRAAFGLGVVGVSISIAAPAAGLRSPLRQNYSSWCPPEGAKETVRSTSGWPDVFFFCAAPMATSVQRQTHEPQRNQPVPGLKPLAVPFPPFFSSLLLFFPSPFWSVLSFSRTRRLFIQQDKQTQKNTFSKFGHCG